MRVHDCNWMQLEDYLSRDGRIVLPIGSTIRPGSGGSWMRVWQAGVEEVRELLESGWE